MTTNTDQLSNDTPKIYFGPDLECPYCTGTVFGGNIYSVVYKNEVYHLYCLCLKLAKQAEKKESEPGVVSENEDFLLNIKSLTGTIDLFLAHLDEIEIKKNSSDNSLTAILKCRILPTKI